MDENFQNIFEGTLQTLQKSFERRLPFGLYTSGPILGALFVRGAFFTLRLTLPFILALSSSVILSKLDFSSAEHYNRYSAEPYKIAHSQQFLT